MLFEIYDSEGSFHYQLRAPDRRSPKPPVDGGAEPSWTVHLWRPDIAARGFHTIPHARLESAVVQLGADLDDVRGIVDAILHWHHMPDPGDQLAWEDEATAAVLDAVADIPDPTWHHDMPAGEKWEYAQARVAAVREHHAVVDPAPLADRAGALAARAFAVAEAERRAFEMDVPFNAAFLVGLEDEAPAHPLDPIASSCRLDPARVEAFRSAEVWMHGIRERPHSRETAMQAPGRIGVRRRLPRPQ